MRIALAGAALSGKTTLAHYLRDHYNYAFVDYTGYLKELAANMLRASGEPRYATITRADIEGNKKLFRPFLQTLSAIMDYDQGGCIEDAMAGVDNTHPCIAFDCIRYQAQYVRLALHGFFPVRLEVPEGVLYARAKVQGLSADEYDATQKHEAEIGVPKQPLEIVLDATWPTEQLAEEIHRLDSVHLSLPTKDKLPEAAAAA